MGGAPGDSRPKGSLEAHEIRRFESAVHSLFVLSENTSLPDASRAACREAALMASDALEPGAPQVPSLIQLAIDVGSTDEPPTKELLLARLRQVGWRGPASALDAPPPPLGAPPPRNLVTDRERRKALDTIMARVQAHLEDRQAPLPRRDEFRRRLEELRRSPADVRSKTDRAWELLEVVERSIEAQAAKERRGG